MKASGVRRQWSMVNGQWSTVNGQWSMVNGEIIGGAGDDVCRLLVQA